VESDKSPLDFAEFMIAGGMSKTLACITFYPHGETLLLAVTSGSFSNIVCVGLVGICSTLYMKGGGRGGGLCSVKCSALNTVNTSHQ